MSGLRDRIAAVLRANDYWDGCTDRKCVLAPDCEGCLYESNEMADAVARELAEELHTAQELDPMLVEHLLDALRLEVRRLGDYNSTTLDIRTLDGYLLRCRHSGRILPAW